MTKWMTYDEWKNDPDGSVRPLAAQLYKACDEDESMEKEWIVQTYVNYLESQGIEHTTEDGEPTPEAFDPTNLDAFVNQFDGCPEAMNALAMLAQLFGDFDFEFNDDGEEEEPEEDLYL